MNPHQLAAGWIDRFASRLQLHQFDREDAISIAAQMWAEHGATSCPERMAEAVSKGWAIPMTVELQ